MQNLAYYLLFSVVLVSGLFIHSRMSFAHPPSWAPAHGYREKEHKHKHHHHKHEDRVVIEKVYYYYPAQEVYYSPQSQQYFWLQAGNWTLGYQLPHSIQLGSSSPVSLSLNTPQPYTQHAWVKQKYAKN